MVLTVGIKHVRDGVERQPVIQSDMSVVGIIGTAPLADTDVFPANVPVYLTSDDSDMLTSLGYDGTIPDAIRGVHDQLLQASAKMVVVRVQVGDDDDATIANIVGSQANRTGMWAFLDAPQLLGVTPRVILASGWTAQHDVSGGVTDVTSAAKPGGNTGNGTLTLATPKYGDGVIAGLYTVRCIGGAKSASSAAKAGGNIGDGTMGSLTADTGAAVGDWRVICSVPATDGGTFMVLNPSGGLDGIAAVGTAYNSSSGINFTIADGATDFEAGDEFVVTVAHSVPSNGGVFEVKDPAGAVVGNATVGTPFTDEVKFTIADGATDFVVGDGFNLTVTVTGATVDANPVCASLPAVLGKLRAVAVVQGPTSSRQSWINWVETIQSDRIIPGSANDVKVIDANGDTVTKPACARIAGLLVRVDQENDGRPFHSSANRPVYGIVGVSRPIDFSLVDDSTEGQDIASRFGGFIVRGESGVESSLSETGFVYWGTDTLSDDPLWQFYHVVRGRDYIELAQIRTLRRYLGKYNITYATIDAILNTMVSELALRTAVGDILGFKVGFEPDKNTPEELRLGHLWVKFQAEEPPVLRKITISSQRYRAALDELVVKVAAAIDQVTV